MRLVTYNTQFSRGRDGRIDIDRMTAAVKDADIIALQEVESFWTRTGMVDQPSEIAKHFPEHYYVFGVNYDMDASYRDGGKLVNRRRRFGNMVLSRWPIASTRTLLLPRSRTLSKINPQRGATEAVITMPGGAFRVYCVHLDHVSPDERIRQLQFLHAHINAFVQEGGSLTGAAEFDLPEPPLPEDYVILGDFNMEPESPEYCALAGAAGGYYGRVARIGTPVDAFAALETYRLESYSWMDPEDHGKRMHLDYCFVSCGLVSRLKSARIDTQSVGSDHFPLWVEIGD